MAAKGPGCARIAGMGLRVPPGPTRNFRMQQTIGTSLKPALKDSAGFPAAATPATANCHHRRQLTGNFLPYNACHIKLNL
jgi:hypothetical protein